MAARASRRAAASRSSQRLEAVAAAGMERAAGRRVRAATAASPRSATSFVEPPLDRRHRLEQPPGVGVLRRRRRSPRRRRTPSPGRAYITSTCDGRLGDDAEIVGDQDHADVELALDAGRSARGSAPGRSRRARSSARRRSGRPDCGRAPSRSSRAGACRRRTGAGSRGRGRRRSGSRPRRAARPSARHAAFRETSAWARTASAIWSPTRYIGWRQANGSWKIIETSRPRIVAQLRSATASAGRCPRRGSRRVTSACAAVQEPHDREARDALARARTRRRRRASRPGAA